MIDVAENLVASAEIPDATGGRRGRKEDSGEGDLPKSTQALFTQSMARGRDSAQREHGKTTEGHRCPGTVGCYSTAGDLSEQPLPAPEQGWRTVLNCEANCASARQAHSTSEASQICATTSPRAEAEPQQACGTTDARQGDGGNVGVAVGRAGSVRSSPCNLSEPARRCIHHSIYGKARA